MTRRVILHVGTPKSGTSYLQDRLACNRDRLRAAGLGYLDTRTGDHFEAALDLLQARWAGAEETARGQWQRLVQQAGSTTSDVLVSHEILAGADAGAVARVHEAFPDAELHVVLTARDLGRQLPAEWQENVKHRSERSYAGFLKRVQRRELTPRDDRFWRVQHLPEILATWSAGLPAERVRVVTVPPSGAPRGLLWERYSAALGLGTQTADWAESRTTNASLGAAEVTLLRLLNAELRERGLERGPYVDWVREGVVAHVLGPDRSSPAATVPPALRPWVDEVSEGWIEQLGATGHTVVGDLQDLRPVWPDDVEAWADPDEPDRDVALARAVDALAWVIDEAAQRAVAPPPPEPVSPSPSGRLRRAVRAWRLP